MLISPSAFEELIDQNIGERLDTLHQSFSTDKTNALLNETFDRLYKNLYSRDQLIDEYNQLSKNIQNIVSNCAQCIHERYKYENDFVLIKDRICQSLGQVGFVQDSLEHYRLIIESLENETERLENLLSQPQLAQMNQQKFQIFEQNQRVQLDRLVKENDRVRKLINKEKESIIVLQRDIERDKNELENLQTSIVQIQFEGKQIQQNRSETIKRSEHLRTTNNRIQQMENEFDQRLKLTKDQYRLAQKQHQSLINTHQQTSEQLSSLTTKEKEIDTQIEMIKNEIDEQQNETTHLRNQLQNLRVQSHELNLQKQQVHQRLKRDEHQNFLVERERRRLESGQRRLKDRLEHLTKQWNEKMDEKHREETKLFINQIHLEKLQRKLLVLNTKTTKLIETNDQLERILQEHRFILNDEKARLRQLKKVSIEKQKRLIEYGKRVHHLSVREHRLQQGIHRFSENLKRSNQLLDQSNRDEKRAQRILREKKTRLMKEEKHRAYVATTCREFDNRIRQLMQRNEFMENELKNKMNQFEVLDKKLIEQNQNQIELNKQKERIVEIYRREKLKCEQIKETLEQNERLAEREMKYVAEKKNENRQLTSNILQRQEQIVHLATRNQRRIDEYTLLTEKISIYQMMNDRCKNESEPLLIIRRIIHRIKSLEDENEQLTKNLRLSQLKSLKIVAAQQFQIVKREQIHQMNSHFSDRSLLIRQSSMRRYDQSELNKYPKLVEQLRKIIEESIHWREKILWINQLYFNKFEEFQLQRKTLLESKTMIDRIRMAKRLRRCQANKAEQWCV